MVWPSGSERATASAAILLLPPVRFSTSTCWRQISDSRPATRRVTASMAPPAAIGQMTRTGRLGQFGGEGCCASARRATEPGASADTARYPANRRRLIMGSTSPSSLPSTAAKRVRASTARLELVQERLLPRAKSHNPRCPAGGRVAMPRLGRQSRLGFNYRCCPCATGGRSLSLLTVFLPTCSPPLSRKKANAKAITAPRRAPSFPLGALLSVIRNLRSSALVGPTPASDRGSCARRTRVELRQTCGAPAERLTKMHGRPPRRPPRISSWVCG